MGLFFPNYGSRLGAAGGRWPSLLVVAALHAGLLALLVLVVPRQPLQHVIRPFEARLIEDKPKAAPPPPQSPRRLRPAPLPILAATTPVFAPSSFVVPVQPPPPAVVPAPGTLPPPVAETAETVLAARFDADYLDNPKPSYPSASRRLGEEGRVVLRVRVSAAGAPEQVDIRKSSGFSRLDDAARQAVTRWRFIPARRGQEAVASWVQVPIIFNLQS